MGSFAMCQVWRMRDRQLRRKKIDWRHDHSHCLHCDYRLRWFDNIPIMSWIALAGKCRKCHEPIGMAEILCEVGLAAVFVISYLFWPFGFHNYIDIAPFLIFLVMLVALTMLFVYDLRWRRLPEKPLMFCVICAVLFYVFRNWGAFSPSLLFDTLCSLAILPGLFFVLYKGSGERLMGGGDYLLSIPFALMIGGPLLAFFVLFVSNLIGSLISIPIVIRKKKNQLAAQVSFGPFLIIGFLIVFFLQNWITSLFFI